MIIVLVIALCCDTRCLVSPPAEYTINVRITVQDGVTWREKVVDIISAAGKMINGRKVNVNSL